MDGFITDRIAELEEVTFKVRSNFGNLGEKQLNWKPGNDKWSIAQVLDHLMVTNKTYYPQFDEIIAGRHKNTFYQNLGFLSRFFGKMMVRDLGPEKPKTYKTPELFTPSQSNISEDIIADFIAHQKELETYFSKLNEANLEETVISSPVSKAIVYNLKDTMLLITGHEQRHLNQALGVLNSQRIK